MQFAKHVKSGDKGQAFLFLFPYSRVHFMSYICNLRKNSLLSENKNKGGLLWETL